MLKLYIAYSKAPRVRRKGKVSIMITNIPFALQLFSIYQEVKDDFVGTLTKLKEYGYSGVEFAGIYGKESSKVQDVCSDIGLVPVSAHIGFDVFVNSGIEKELDFVKSLGVKYVVVPFLHEEYRQGEGFDFWIKTMLQISKAAAERDLKLGYHNHNFEFNTKVGEKYLLDHIFDTVGAENVYAQLDIGWVSIGKEDPFKYINKYKGFVPNIHIKDFYFPDLIPEDKRDPDEVDYFDFRPMGRGSLDIPKVFKTAEEAGTEWFIVEQDDKSYKYTDWTKMDCVRMSMEYVRSLG